MTETKNIPATAKDIRKLTLPELTTWMKEQGEPAFRAKQVNEWLWKKSAHSFDEMTNLSKNLRQLLKEQFVINHLAIDLMQKSADDTIKVRFRIFDGPFIEGVLIPTPDRITACISSQVGCSLSCKFCATGYLKRVRNLNADEIYDQVVLLNRLSEEHYGRRLTNIVFMGMGEPLLNYKNMLEGVEKITSEEGLNFGAKRITVSTAGIAKMIRKLGDDGVKFNLALSLHATTDEKRNEIMPINEQNNLPVLIEALNYFYQKTHNQITFEYILLKGVNDTPADAERLVALTKKVPAKVNIIEYNPIAEANFEKSEDSSSTKFRTILERSGVTNTMRRSRGKDIDAACGQLANKG